MMHAIEPPEPGDLWVFGYGSLIVAARFRRPRAGTGAADRPAPVALRLFVRPSRHPGAAGPRSGPRSRRHVPRHCVPRRRGGAGRDHRLSAGARAGHQRLPRNGAAYRASKTRPGARCGRSATSSDRGHVQYAGRLPLAKACTSCARATAGPGRTGDYVIETVPGPRGARLSRRPELHRLAERLNAGMGSHEAAIRTQAPVIGKRARRSWLR